MIRFWEDFEELVLEYEIERKDICIVGSGVLTAEGFRENHDFDFAVTEKAREKLLRVYGDKLNVLPTGTICFTDDIQILQNRYGEVGVDDKLLFTEKYSRSYENEYRIAIREVELAKKNSKTGCKR